MQAFKKFKNTRSLSELLKSFQFKAHQFIKVSNLSKLFFPKNLQFFPSISPSVDVSLQVKEKKIPEDMKEEKNLFTLHYDEVHVEHGKKWPSSNIDRHAHTSTH